jgi:quercetin dioxygenase-like cupin family protein
MRVAVAFIALLFAAPALAQGSAVVRKMSESKFGPVAGLPTCIHAAVQSGDPAKGASILLFRGKAGCTVPWHWHTPTENVMMVSGSAKFEMKDQGATTVGPGGYAMMPSKHVHRFTCTSACTGFVTSDAAFDIHYVDASGKEIRPEAALPKKRRK